MPGIELDIAIYYEPYNEGKCCVCGELIVSGMIQVWQFGKGLEMEVIIPKTDPVIFCIPCYVEFKKECREE